MDRPDVGIFFTRPDRGHRLAEQLRARGFPAVFYNDAGAPGTYVPVPYAFGPALRRLLATRHDVYLTSLSFVPSLALCLQRAVRGRPYVFNATGLKAAMYRDRARGWRAPALAERVVYPALMRAVLAGAAAIVCNSRYLEDALRSAFPRYDGKLLTIYNGVDVDRFAALDARPAARRSPPVLAAVMTWNYPAKTAGARLLIEAMGPVIAKRPGTRLVIAAKVGHRRHAAGIEAWLARLPWRDAVRIVYNHPRVAELLAEADLFVYATAPGSNDSLPRALIEAQAAGLPAVATATAGCPEIVQDGVTGFTVAYDARAVAERVLDLLADPALRETFGRRGRQRARDTFNWDRMGDAYAHLLQNISTDRRLVVKAEAAPSVPVSGAAP